MNIHPILANRRSVRAFADRLIPTEDLEAMLEAARWAPSNGNRQPWRFILRNSEDGRAAMGPCLSRGNQWAVKAAALATVVCRLSDGGYSNNIHYAIYDCGLAVMSLTFEAESRGIRVHQMAGWIRDPLVRELQLPEGYEPVVVLAMGYPGDASRLDPALQAKEARPRIRRPANDIWTFDRWNPKWSESPGGPG